jgi:hypothetical protein
MFLIERSLIMLTNTKISTIYRTKKKGSWKSHSNYAH